MGDGTRRHLTMLSETPVKRRPLVLALAASAALSGCSRPPREKILPYGKNPPHVTPGIPRLYATSLTLDGFARGVLVLSHEGRPTKVEGNPDHPASLGATSAIEQASLRDLYDPSRAVDARTPEGPSSWDTVAARLGALAGGRGERLRFLLDHEGSPLVGALIARVRGRHPEARFTFFSAARHGFEEEGARIAQGARALPIYDFGGARVVLSLDDDLVAEGPFALRYARQIAARRREIERAGGGVRLYVVETTMSPTGTLADHRIPRRPSEVALFALRVAAEIAHGNPRRRAPEGVRQALSRLRPSKSEKAELAVARDLLASPGAAIVTAGVRQPPIVHALANLVNAMLADEGAASMVTPPLVSAGEGDQDLASLAAEIARGEVDTLVITAQNPAFTAPADLELSRLLPLVPKVLYLGARADETSSFARYFVPRAHDLEAWGDARALDGTASLVQPLIAPLHRGRTVAEVLSIFTDGGPRGARELLVDHWSSEPSARTGDFQAFFRRAVSTGVVPNSASPKLARALDEGALARAVLGFTPPAQGALEIRFDPDPFLHDGRFAENPWLIELPRPATKLTWDNAALMSAATAARLGVSSEDVVELSLGDRRVTAPVLVAPGHADEAVTVHLGWGRSGALSGGFDAGRLRTTKAPCFAAGLSLRRLPGQRHDLARSQLTFSAEGRPIAPALTLAELRGEPGLTAHLKGDEPSFYAAPSARGDQWAMTIDTTICTACSACVAACQAENNIQVVGREEVARGRIMHWIRIDTYLSGPPERPRVVNEPMACQHCERAPCEYVCPVNATVHSPDGLNEMVYNRCVGTRFCSNNCPYKVRRFNWFDYHDHRAENRGAVTLQRNPEVTVRERGVMEKCTYCVQRIRKAEIQARIEDRAIRPGEVVTACQAACPTEAIQFGSLAHRDTKMVLWRAEARSFEVLHDLGTRPRTVYLARVDDPNPEMP